MTVITDVIAGPFRAQWATRFVDEVNVLRFDDATPGTFNDTTGKYDGAAPTVVVSGGGIPNALLRPTGGQADEEELLNELRTYQAFAVFMAWDAPQILVEDRIVVVSSALDSRLDGSELRVTAVIPDSYNTKTHLIAELDLGRGSGRG